MINLCFPRSPSSLWLLVCPHICQVVLLHQVKMWHSGDTQWQLVTDGECVWRQQNLHQLHNFQIWDHRDMRTLEGGGRGRGGSYWSTHNHGKYLYLKLSLLCLTRNWNVGAGFKCGNQDTLWRNSLKYELTNSTICLQWMESCERWSRDSFSEYFLWPPASHYRSSGVHCLHTQPFFTIFRVWWECLTCFCDWESVEFSWLYHSNC